MVHGSRFTVLVTFLFPFIPHNFLVFFFYAVHFVQFSLRTHPFSIYFLRDAPISNVIISTFQKKKKKKIGNTIHILLEHAVLCLMYSLTVSTVCWNMRKGGGCQVLFWTYCHVDACHMSCINEEKWLWNIATDNIQDLKVNFDRL